MGTAAPRLDGSARRRLRGVVWMFLGCALWLGACAGGQSGTESPNQDPTFETMAAVPLDGGLGLPDECVDDPGPTDETPACAGDEDGGAQ